MRGICKALICAAALSIVATAAAARELIEVRAGSKTRLGFISIYDPGTCGHAGKPGIKITNPAHGKLTAVWGSGKIDTRSSCNGRSSKGYTLWLTMDRGFRGKDKAAINLTYAGNVNGSVDTSQYLPFDIQSK